MHAAPEPLLASLRDERPPTPMIAVPHPNATADRDDLPAPGHPSAWRAGSCAAFACMRPGGHAVENRSAPLSRWIMADAVETALALTLGTMSPREAAAAAVGAVGALARASLEARMPHAGPPPPAAVAAACIEAFCRAAGAVARAAAAGDGGARGPALAGAAANLPLAASATAVASRGGSFAHLPGASPRPGLLSRGSGSGQSRTPPGRAPSPGPARRGSLQPALSSASSIGLPPSGPAASRVVATAVSRAARIAADASSEADAPPSLASRAAAELARLSAAVPGPEGDGARAALLSLAIGGKREWRVYDPKDARRAAAAIRSVAAQVAEIPPTI